MHDAARSRPSPALKAGARCGGTCGRQNAFLEALPRCEAHVARSARQKTRIVFPSAPCRAAELCQRPSSGPKRRQVRASRRRRTARCPTPRRNVRDPLVDAPTQALRPSDEAAPDTESPVAATRHEPPDAPRSGKKLSRVHPARDALTLAAPRLSPPRSKIHAGRRFLARQRPSHAPRPCRATLPLGSGRNNLARLRAEPVLRRAQNVFLRRSGQLPHLVQRRSDRPTGKEKRRDSLSLTKRWPEAEAGGQHAGIPALRAEPAQRRSFPRASGTSSIGSRPQNARNVRREFHKPFRSPFQRLVPARLGNTFTPRRHWGTTAHAPRIVKKYSCV